MSAVASQKTVSLSASDAGSGAGGRAGTAPAALALAKTDPPQAGTAATSQELVAVREKLVKQFSGALAAAAVRTEVDRIIARFTNARVRTYIPVLVQHIARDRLRFLTRSGSPTV